MKKGVLFLVLFLVTNHVFANLNFRGVTTDTTCEIEYSYVFNCKNSTTENGMYPLVLKITNNTTELRTWTIESSASRWQIQSDGIKQNLSVEGNSSRTFILLLPFKGSEEPSFTLSGPGINAGQYFGSSSINSIDNGVIVSKKTIDANNLINFNQVQIFESESLTYFPESWLGYTAISKIIMTTREFNGLRDEQKVAIRDWLLNGGNLDCVLDSQSENERIVKFLKVGNNGLGSFNLQKKASHFYYESNKLKEFYKNYNLQTTDELWRAFDEPEVSFLLVFFLLVSFLVVVGPVNIFVLTKNNRLKLLLTTPLISVGASLLFLLVIILYDGFGGEGEKRNFVWLNPEVNRCSINQTQISKTGIMISSKFKRDREYLFLPYRKAENTAFYYNPQASEYIRAGFTFNGNTVTRDIFNSRSRRLVYLNDVKTTQSSVEFIDGEVPSIRSNIKGKLEKIILVDNMGKLWYVDKCDTGEVVNLRPVRDVNNFEEKPVLIEKILPNHLTKDDFDRVANSKKFFFFAQINGDTEFDIPTHDGIEWQKKMTLIGGDLVKGAL